MRPTPCVKRGGRRGDVVRKGEACVGEEGRREERQVVGEASYIWRGQQRPERTVHMQSTRAGTFWQEKRG